MERALNCVTERVHVHSVPLFGILKYVPIQWVDQETMRVFQRVVLHEKVASVFVMLSGGCVDFIMKFRDRLCRRHSITNTDNQNRVSGIYTTNSQHLNSFMTSYPYQRALCNVIVSCHLGTSEISHIHIPSQSRC
jgi:hypothetical protein